MPQEKLVKERTRKLVISFLVMLLIVTPVCFAECSGDEAFTEYGDVAQIVIPVVAFGATLIKKDWEGTKQFCYQFACANATTGLLKYTVNAKRPNGKRYSFPSGHTTAAMAGAAFVQRRYGWEWGVPLYVAASAVAYSRVRSRNHYWRDVVAGTVIGVGCNMLFTTKYKTVDVEFTPLGEGGMVSVVKRW